MHFTNEDRRWLYDNFADYFFTDRQTIKTTNYLPVNLAYVQSPEQPPHVYNLVKLRVLGGDRLVTFYLCDCNYELAAKALNIRQSTLRSSILRLKKKFEDLGIDALMFDRLCRQNY